MGGLYDLGRATVAAAAILMVSGFGGFGPGRALAQPLEGMMGPGPVRPEVAVGMAGGQIPGGAAVTPQDQISLLQWGVREGGAFAVILVILFFYRRDWKTATEFWRDQHAITTKLVQDTTAAQVDMAAALRENTVVVHQAKHALAAVSPSRRYEDRVGG